MRLIDADALIDDLKHDVAIDQDSLDYEELTDSNRENIQFDKDCKQNAIDLLKNAPTIEPERKKGEWKRTVTGHPYCSSCNWFPEENEMTGFFYDFCPNCGADMRGEKDG